MHDKQRKMLVEKAFLDAVVSLPADTTASTAHTRRVRARVRIDYHQ